MTSTAAMEAGSTSVERLLAAAVATMEKARYCWAITVAEDGSVNARPMGPQTSRRAPVTTKSASCLPHAEQRKRDAHSALVDQRHSVMPARRAAARKISIGQRAGGKAYGLHRETPAQILYCRWIRTESGE